MMRKITALTTLSAAAFAVGVAIGSFTDTPDVQPVMLDNPQKHPVIVAAPVAPVHIEKLPLPEPYPWADVDGYLLDCDKERKSERISLACNIYHEARGESDAGQVAVALVTRNRVLSERYPDTYAAVVWDIRRSKKTKRKVAQFSWALDGRSDRVKDKDAWHKAWLIAGDVIAGRVKDFTKGAMYYHSKKVKPVWRKKFQVSLIVDNHIFYVRP